MTDQIASPAIFPKTAIARLIRHFRLEKIAAVELTYVKFQSSGGTFSVSRLIKVKVDERNGHYITLLLSEPNGRKRMTGKSAPERYGDCY